MRSISLLLLLVAMVSCGTPAKQAQKTFAAPEDAVMAMADAARAANTAELKAIFGPDGHRILASGDPVMDQVSVQKFLAAYDERARLVKENDKRLLLVGKEEWPFPIPLIKDGKNWRFDTAAGETEVRCRRIGCNELSTIAVCRTFVEAQKEYAKKSHDGHADGAYAQRFASTPGKQDGLYWKTGPLEDPSPLGELVARAAAEGYHRPWDKPVPFHGYYFRILTAEGPNTYGGPRNYLQNGEMRGGFALIAAPAEYGYSGVMTFIVNHDGVVSEKDFGPGTAKIAAEITAYNPDATWNWVE